MQKPNDIPSQELRDTPTSTTIIDNHKNHLAEDVEKFERMYII